MSFALALTTYLMSSVLSFAFSVKRDAKVFRQTSLIFLGVAVLANAWWIAARWLTVGHPPFAETYGCLVLLATCVGLVSLMLELVQDVRFLGGISSLAAAGIMIFSTRFAGPVHPLVPALQSPYFAPHVLAYFVAYGALSIAGLASVPYLIVSFNRDDSFTRGLEAWIFRSVQIGFPFLTLGLVLGAFWAQAAYTDYWSWDLKEVWALITWLLVTAWLHRWQSGRRGIASAILMIVAVGALYFTLLGLHLLPTASQSLHTYSQP